MKLFRSLGWGVVGLSLSGCTDPAQPQGCDVCFSTAVANVYVRDSTLQPVPRVLVEVRAYLRQCGSGFLGGEGPLASDSSGHRRMLMSSLDSPQTALCLVVTVTSNSTPSQPIGSWEFADSVQFRAEDGTGKLPYRVDS